MSPFTASRRSPRKLSTSAPTVGFLERSSPGARTLAFSFNATTHLGAGLLIDRRTSAAQLDAFVYGFETAAAAVPRTGSASFNVTLNGGVLAPGADFQSLSGFGGLNVNLASGAISTLGTYTVSTVLPVFTLQPPGTTTDSGSWTGNATLSAVANLFAGTFAMDGTTDYSGDILGQFFGPAAEEVGAVVDAQREQRRDDRGDLERAREARERVLRRPGCWTLSAPRCCREATRSSTPRRSVSPTPGDRARPVPSTSPTIPSRRAISSCRQAGSGPGAVVLDRLVDRGHAKRRREQRDVHRLPGARGSPPGCSIPDPATRRSR